MKAIRPQYILSIIGTVIIACIAVFGIIPQYRSIFSQRDSLDSLRISLESLNIQKQNIDVVAANYTALQKKESSIEALVLNEKKSIEFFNSVDGLFSKTGATDFNFRMDTPTRTNALQLIGIHLTFTNSYEGVVSFLRSITALPEAIRLDTISLGTSTTGSQVVCTLDGSVAWNQTQ